MDQTGETGGELAEEVVSVSREVKRQTLHVAMAGFALLLRYLAYWQALILAAFAVVFNLFFLPKFKIIRKEYYREEEKSEGFSKGMFLYAVGVFLAILAFPIPVAAAVYAVLAFGDGFATLLGKPFGTKKLFWNKNKSYVGLVAFVMAATPAAAFFFWWAQVNAGGSNPLWNSRNYAGLFQEMGWLQVTGICFVTSLACGVVESLPVKTNDNLVIPLFGGLMMTLMALWLG